MSLHVQVGQTVACLGSGAFSEYVTAKAASCYPIREASAQACACVVSGLTAAAALEVRPFCRVTLSCWISCTGAGCWALQGALQAGVTGCHPATKFVP